GLAQGAKLVMGRRPHKARIKSLTTTLHRNPHWKMAMYSSRCHLLTPRNGRRKLRNPVQIPSRVLLCTSRTPSPSSSRAPSRSLWHTVPCPRPVAAIRLYPVASSVYSVTPGGVVRSTTSVSVAPSTDSTTCRCKPLLSRPTTPLTGGRSFCQLPSPRALLARRRGGSSALRCGSPFFPRILEHLVR